MCSSIQAVLKLCLSILERLRKEEKEACVFYMYKQAN